jgi:proteic killer suppression protein
MIGVIVSFGDDATSDLFHGVDSARVRRFPTDVRKRAIRKLDMLNAAADINDMRVPPSNHLEKLAGDLVGFWSVRVNEQWRIIFRFTDRAASEVRLVDYH